MPSKQFAHLQEQSLLRLRAMIPHDCPLTVARDPRGFRVSALNERVELMGRFQIVAAFISGYVAGWAKKNADHVALDTR